MIPPKLALKPAALKAVQARLRKANAAFAKTHPGETGDRQAVHVVYGGAHLFKSDTAPRLGQLAVKALEEYAPEAGDLAEALGLPGGDFAETLYGRVLDKLKSEPVEDFRIDFEDGFGNRPDAEEDHHASLSAEETAHGLHAGTLPPFFGIRIKPLTGELSARSLRTLDVYLTTLTLKTKGRLPSGFVVTLPKVTRPEHVSALAQVLGLLEGRLKLPKGTLKIELMIETPQSILDEDGAVVLPALVAAGGGRCVSAHFGTYDYTALCDITAAHQTMVHPACDFAKEMMRVSLAQTGIKLSDGATNVMPVPLHRAEPGSGLTPSEAAANRAAVHRAWKLHFDHVRHSLVTGYYQGWDLHPAQLPTRYAAVFSFFLEGRAAASQRLKNFVEKAAQATLVGDVFDDAATGQGLLNFFLRGLNSGAITYEEAAATGLTPEEFRSRSFVKILAARRASVPAAA